MIRRKSKGSEMILAQGVTHRLRLKSSLYDNVLVVGAPRRGKTRQYIKSNIMQANRNYVVVDPNGHLVQELGKMLEKEDYFIQVVNFADPSLSEKYNPMHFLRKDADVFSLIDYIISSINKDRLPKDPFWERAATLLISSIMFYLMYEYGPEERTFANLLRLLRAHDVSEYYDTDSILDVLMKDMKDRDPEHIAVKQYQHFKNATGSINTESSIVATALVYLQEFISDDLECLTEKNTVDFEAIAYRKSALFIVTSESDRSRDWLFDLFFHQLYDFLCNRDSYFRDVHFILDNFPTLGKITDFDRKLSTFRRHLLSASIVLQDESQLEVTYGSAAARCIISNCDHYVFMGSNNMDLCEKVAQRTGKKSITGAKLLRLPYDKCVVISGRKSGVYPKYKLEKHPRYKEIVDELVNYPSPKGKWACNYPVVRTE